MKLGIPTITTLLVLAAGVAQAQEPRGTWKWKDAEKPVKVVVLGGSVSAYGLGGYSQWIPAACKHIEVHNAAKAKLGANALKQRFVAQVIQNRKLDLKASETWLVFLGGLNSVGTPELTNIDVAKTFELAHDAGMKTMGLTVNPWGSEDDHRWQGAKGLEYFAHTQKTVDFVLGRLSPVQAFGKTAAQQAAFEPGQLPDVAVDLWDGALRDRHAPLRPEKGVLRAVKTSAWVKKQLASSGSEGRNLELEDWAMKVRQIPSWFMRREFIGFDAVHPNAAGHKEIARAICQKAPPSWGCDCALFDQLAWDKKARKPTMP